MFKIEFQNLFINRELSIAECVTKIIRSKKLGLIKLLIWLDMGYLITTIREQLRFDSIYLRAASTKIDIELQNCMHLEEYFCETNLAEYGVVMI